MSEVTFHEMRRGDDVAFKAAFAIYREAIAPSEQRTKADLRLRMSIRGYHFFIARRGADIIAMSAAYMLPWSKFWLYEYAAVAPAERGKGVGAALFRANQEFARDRIALVEADALVSNDPKSDEARRLAFYARLGFRRLGAIDYQLPLRTNGMPPPMVLLALVPPEVGEIPLDDVRSWLREIYVEVYQQDHEDPRIDQMLSGALPNVPLSVL